VVAYGTESKVLPALLWIIGGLTALQIIAVLWAVVAGWDDAYAYALASVKNNTRLTADFDELARAPMDKLDREMDRLRFEYKRQDEDDRAQELSPSEERFAMRSALSHYRIACPACGTLPKSGEKSRCEKCGNY